MKTASRVALHQAIEERYIQDTDAWYETSLSPYGRIGVVIVSDCFEKIPPSRRREEITQLVHKFSPSTPIDFITSITIEEAFELQRRRPDGPPPVSDLNDVFDWFDVSYYTANAMEPSTPRHEPRTPKSIAFHSFKGGVGKTTALAYVATILAGRGRRVLAVDLDMASPGLGAVLNVPPSKLEQTLIDYLYQYSLFVEGINMPTSPIEPLACEIPLDNTTGQLFVVPAGNLTSLGYITEINQLEADKDVRKGKDLWSTFYQEIVAYLRPDIILVDAQTGFDKWSAFALIHAADQALLFLYPDSQNLQGTRLVIRALNGMLPLEVVFSRVPLTSDKGMEMVRRQWNILRADEQEMYGHLNGHANPLMAKRENPLVIPSLPDLAFAEELPLENLLPYYTELADLIDKASLPADAQAHADTQ